MRLASLMIFVIFGGLCLASYATVQIEEDKRVASGRFRIEGNVIYVRNDNSFSGVSADNGVWYDSELIPGNEFIRIAIEAAGSDRSEGNLRELCSHLDAYIRPQPSMAREKKQPRRKKKKKPSPKTEDGTSLDAERTIPGNVSPPTQAVPVDGMPENVIDESATPPAISVSPSDDSASDTSEASTVIEVPVKNSETADRLPSRESAEKQLTASLEQVRGVPIGSASGGVNPIDLSDFSMGTSRESSESNVDLSTEPGPTPEVPTPSEFPSLLRRLVTSALFVDGRLWWAVILTSVCNAIGFYLYLEPLDADSCQNLPDGNHYYYYPAYFRDVCVRTQGYPYADTAYQLLYVLAAKEEAFFLQPPVTRFSDSTRQKFLDMNLVFAADYNPVYLSADSLSFHMWILSEVVSYWFVQEKEGDAGLSLTDWFTENESISFGFIKNLLHLSYILHGSAMNYREQDRILMANFRAMFDLYYIHSCRQVTLKNWQEAPEAVCDF